MLTELDHRGQPLDEKARKRVSSDSYLVRFKGPRVRCGISGSCTTLPALPVTHAAYAGDRQHLTSTPSGSSSVERSAKRLGISRNTVRRYLRSETIEPAYAERRSKRAIDQYAFQLSAMLKTEEARSRKHRRTLKHILEGLKEFGFEGGVRHGRCVREDMEGRSNRPDQFRSQTNRNRFRLDVQ